MTKLAEYTLDGVRIQTCKPDINKSPQHFVLTQSVPSLTNPIEEIDSNRENFNIQFILLISYGSQHFSGTYHHQSTVSGNYLIGKSVTKVDCKTEHGRISQINHYSDFLHEYKETMHVTATCNYKVGDMMSIHVLEHDQQIES